MNKKDETILIILLSVVGSIVMLVLLFRVCLFKLRKWKARDRRAQQAAAEAEPDNGAGAAAGAEEDKEELELLPIVFYDTPSLDGSESSSASPSREPVLDIALHQPQGNQVYPAPGGSRASTAPSSESVDEIALRQVQGLRESPRDVSESFTAAHSRGLVSDVALHQPQESEASSPDRSEPYTTLSKESLVNKAIHQTHGFQDSPSVDVDEQEHSVDVDEQLDLDEREVDEQDHSINVYEVAESDSACDTETNAVNMNEYADDRFYTGSREDTVVVSLEDGAVVEDDAVVSLEDGDISVQVGSNIHVSQEDGDENDHRAVFREAGNSQETAQDIVEHSGHDENGEHEEEEDTVPALVTEGRSDDDSDDETLTQDSSAEDDESVCEHGELLLVDDDAVNTLRSQDLESGENQNSSASSLPLMVMLTRHDSDFDLPSHQETAERSLHTERASVSTPSIHQPLQSVAPRQLGLVAPTDSSQETSSLLAMVTDPETTNSSESESPGEASASSHFLRRSPASTNLVSMCQDSQWLGPRIWNPQPDAARTPGAVFRSNVPASMRSPRDLQVHVHPQYRGVVGMSPQQPPAYTVDPPSYEDISEPAQTLASASDLEPLEPSQDHPPPYSLVDPLTPDDQPDTFAAAVSDLVGSMSDFLRQRIFPEPDARSHVIEGALRDFFQRFGLGGSAQHGPHPCGENATSDHAVGLGPNERRQISYSREELLALNPESGIDGTNGVSVFNSSIGTTQTNVPRMRDFCFPTESSEASGSTSSTIHDDEPSRSATTPLGRLTQAVRDERHCRRRHVFPAVRSMVVYPGQLHRQAYVRNFAVAIHRDTTDLATSQEASSQDGQSDHMDNDTGCLLGYDSETRVQCVQDLQATVETDDQEGQSYHNGHVDAASGLYTCNPEIRDYSLSNHSNNGHIGAANELHTNPGIGDYSQLAHEETCQPNCLTDGMWNYPYSSTDHQSQDALVPSWASVPLPNDGGDARGAGFEMEESVRSHGSGQDLSTPHQQHTPPLDSRSFEERISRKLRDNGDHTASPSVSVSRRRPFALLSPSMSSSSSSSSSSDDDDDDVFFGSNVSSGVSSNVSSVVSSNVSSGGANIPSRTLPNSVQTHRKRRCVQGVSSNHRKSTTGRKDSCEATAAVRSHYSNCNGEVCEFGDAMAVCCHQSNRSASNRNSHKTARHSEPRTVRNRRRSQSSFRPEISSQTDSSEDSVHVNNNAQTRRYSGSRITRNQNSNCDETSNNTGDVLEASGDIKRRSIRGCDQSDLNTSRTVTNSTGIETTSSSTFANSATTTNTISSNTTHSSTTPSTKTTPSTNSNPSSTTPSPTTPSTTIPIAADANNHNAVDSRIKFPFPLLRDNGTKGPKTVEELKQHRKRFFGRRRTPSTQ